MIGEIISSSILREIESGWGNTYIPNESEFFIKLHESSEDLPMYDTQQELRNWAKNTNYIEASEKYHEHISIKYFAPITASYYIGSFIYRIAIMIRDDINALKFDMTSYKFLNAVSDKVFLNKILTYLNNDQITSIVRISNLNIDYYGYFFKENECDIIELKSSVCLLRNRQASLG
jgi:hypothetical protein